MATPDGEIATARGTGRSGAGYCYNWMLSSKLYTDVIEEPGCKWLHLYIFQERDLVEASLKAAEATGAFSAVILTCDHPHTRVQRRMLPYFQSLPRPNPSSDPTKPFFPNQAAVGFDDCSFEDMLQWDDTRPPPGGTNDSTLSWDDVKWIKSKTKLPVVAKGIISAEDAKCAINAGVDAIVVSNHGGRQFDLAPPAIEALPAVVAAVKGKIPVLVDSGFRTSGDIIRAICLGATGVLLGRPALWAMACDGSDGLERMLTNLRMDLECDMRSLGVSSLSQLGMTSLWPPDRERIEQITRACCGQDAS